MARQIYNLATGSSSLQGACVADIPTPEISDNEVLVKVRAVAINPIDFKSVDVIAPNKSVIGCDYAGEVVLVGKKAEKRWSVGNRVAGFVHGGQYSDIGSFAEYLKVDGELAWKIPPTLSDSEAATYGVAAVTAVLALAKLAVPLEDVLEGKAQSVESKKSTILIYSGGSNVGLFAIQAAKRAGLQVVATASPQSFGLVKSYGADSVYDYHSQTAISEIREAYPNTEKALDCFSGGKSSEFCTQVMQKGRVINLLDQGKSPKPNVEYKTILVFTAFGRPFSWLAPLGPQFPVEPNDPKLLRDLYAHLGVLCEHSLRPPPITAMQGGFNGILEALNRIRQGEVRGTKLVVSF